MLEMDITETINDHKALIRYLNTKYPEFMSKTLSEFDELDKLFATLCLYIPPRSNFLKFKESFMINQTNVFGLQYYYKSVERGGYHLDKWNTTVIAKDKNGLLYEERIPYNIGVIKILIKQLETNI